jgi:hypothetical protein
MIFLPCQPDYGNPPSIPSNPAIARSRNCQRIDDGLQRLGEACPNPMDGQAIQPGPYGRANRIQRTAKMHKDESGLRLVLLAQGCALPRELVNFADFMRAQLSRQFSLPEPEISHKTRKVFSRLTNKAAYPLPGIFQ